MNNEPALKGEPTASGEPVAYVDPIWMQRPDLVMSHDLEIGKLFARTQFKNYVPLYTAEQLHPAKTLTDEEIIKTMVQFDVYSADDQCLIDAGRAILKKASEK